MAVRNAVANGNWSNTATWNGGTLPSPGDDVHANTFTVTVDQTVNVASLRTTAGTGITAGGTFSVTSSQSITLTGVQGVFPGNSVNPVVSISHSTGTVTISGVFISGSGANQVAINITGTGNVNIIGPTGSSAGTGANCVTISNTATGSITVTGAITGSASGGGAGVNSLSATATVSIVGNVLGGPSGPGITTIGQLSIVGDLTAAALPAVALTSTGVITSHSGRVVASATNNGVSGTVSANSITSTGPFLSSSTRSALMVSQIKIALVTTTTYWEFPTGDSSTRRLYTTDSIGGNPSVADVREGTVFGIDSDLVGILSVPSPVDVREGVETDNTVGSAQNLDAESFWEYLLTDDLPNGSAGQKLKRLMIAIMG